MFRNQSLSLDDESIKTTGALTYKFDLYSDFYLIKSFLGFALLTLSIFSMQNLILKLFCKWIAPTFYTCIVKVFLFLCFLLELSFSSKLMLIFLSHMWIMSSEGSIHFLLFLISIHPGYFSTIPVLSVSLK